ncbi:MAG: galactose mutarotase [Tissierellales bacterium]|nr:galactose mutarotase [Tissierellales bacterium]
MKYVKKDYFGTTKNLNNVYKFTIFNNRGTEVDIINYGATVTSFKIKNSFGHVDDIVLGYDNLKDYENGNKFFGAIIGRCANRISKASFRLNNKVYTLKNNEGENHIHGGDGGFHRRIWNYEIKERGVCFTYVSEDMEEGYPGRCTLNVEYTLTDENELFIDYTGETTKDTVLNPTNHCYFNLNGHNNGTILKHRLIVNADNYTPIDSYSIPTGEIHGVEDTPFDLRKSKIINDIINKKHKQLLYGKGLDHNFCINGYKDELKLGAILESDNKERKLLVYTTLPGIQVYTGSNIGKEKGKNNSIYEKHSGICLETQYYPNSINIPEFESPILKAGEIYSSRTIYKVE